MNKKSGKNARRPVWMNKLLLAKFRHQKESIQRLKARMGNL